MTNAVRTVRRGKVLEITLDRPPVNAVDDATSMELYKAFNTLQEDDDLLVGLVTSAGSKIFSAGWDLKGVAAADNPDDTESADGASPGGFCGIVEYWDLHKPVICAVNGHVVGGGFEFVLATDIILAADHVEFWLPEMQRGFVAAAGAIQRLPRRIPYNVAMELFYTGRHMGAAEAKHWGLVAEVLPSDKLLDRARELADQLSQCSPLALQAQKAIMPVVMSLTVEEAMQVTKRQNMERDAPPIYVKMKKSDDFLEGSRAFVEKRKPRWKGR